MKPLMMAALVVQLTSAGGAGSGNSGDLSRSGSSMKDVGRHYSALKTEVTSLTQQYHAAREKARLRAERQKQESEGSYAPPQRSTAAVTVPGGKSF